MTAGGRTAAPPLPGPASATTAGDTLAVGTWTLVSRVTGLARIVAIGAILGPTYLGNTFLATNVLPNLTYEFLTGSLFATLLVPPLVRHVDLRDRRAVERLAGGFLGTAMVAFALLIVAAVLAGPLILRALSLGVDDPLIASAQRRAGWFLLALLMPQVALYGVAGVSGAVLNAHGRFGLPAAAPAMENLGVIVTLVVYAVFFRGGTALEAVTTTQLLVLGLGTTAAVGAHAGAVWLGVWRLGVRLVPRAGWRDREVREIIARMVPSLGYAGLNAARQSAILVVANRVPGGVVAFHLALNFFHLPVAVGAKPIAVALLPQLARHHHCQDAAGFGALFSRGLSLVCLLTVPAAMAYAVLAEPLARAVSFGEMAGGAGVPLIAGSLAALSAGVVGEGVFNFATHGSYARHDAKAPLAAMVVRSTVSLVGMAAAFLLAGGVGVLVVLGLAVSAGNAASAWHLTRRVRRGHAERLYPSIGRTVIAASLMILPAYATAVAVAGWAGGPAGDVAGVVAAAVVGATLFVGALIVLRSPDLVFLRAGMKGSTVAPRRTLDPSGGRP